MFNYCVEIEALEACFHSYNDDDDNEDPAELPITKPVPWCNCLVSNLEPSALVASTLIMTKPFNPSKMLQVSTLAAGTLTVRVVCLLFSRKRFEYGVGYEASSRCVVLNFPPVLAAVNHLHKHPDSSRALKQFKPPQVKMRQPANEHQLTLNTRGHCPGTNWQRPPGRPGKTWIQQVGEGTPSS